MDLRGAGPRSRPPTQSILTSTMTRISPSTGSSGKSSFLQLQSVPPALRPLVRAYLLGYASVVLPRLLTLVLQHLSNRKRKTPNYALPERDENTFLESAKQVLKTGLDPCRFPTFCAALVGGSTLLQVRHALFFVRSQNPALSISINRKQTNTLTHSCCILITYILPHTPPFPHTFPNLPQFPFSDLDPVTMPLAVLHHKPPQT